jgi:hypothetical protein
MTQAKLVVGPVQHKSLGSAAPSTVGDSNAGEMRQQFVRICHGLCRLRHDMKKLCVNQLRIAIVVVRSNNDLAFFIRLQDPLKCGAHVLLLLSKQSDVFDCCRCAAWIEDIICVLTACLCLQRAVDGVPLLVLLQNRKMCRVV